MFVEWKLVLVVTFKIVIASQLECIAEDSPKKCGNTSCQALSEAVHQIVGKISIPRPTGKTFKSFKAGSSMPDILRAAGVPAKDVGSGLHVLVYEFENGSSCTVGTENLRGKAMYINCD